VIMLINVKFLFLSNLGLFHFLPLLFKCRDRVCFGDGDPYNEEARFE